MNNTIVLNLLPSTLDMRALIDTFTAYNTAKRTISKFAHENKCYNKHVLSENLYHSLRAETSLPSQLVVSAIGTVVHDYKSSRSVLKSYEDLEPVMFDRRVVSFKGLTTTSISTTIGRIDIPFTVFGYEFWADSPKQVGYSRLEFNSAESGGQFKLHSVIV